MLADGTRPMCACGRRRQRCRGGPPSLRGARQLPPDAVSANCSTGIRACLIPVCPLPRPHSPNTHHQILPPIRAQAASGAVGDGHGKCANRMKKKIVQERKSSTHLQSPPHLPPPSPLPPLEHPVLAQQTQASTSSSLSMETRATRPSKERLAVRPSVGPAHPIPRDGMDAVDAFRWPRVDEVPVAGRRVDGEASDDGAAAVSCRRGEAQGRYLLHWFAAHASPPWT